MQLSRDEYLRVSQLRPARGTMSTIGTAPASGFGMIATAPTRRPEVVGGQVTEDAEARRLAEIVEEASDVREDVVASLRARIEAGTYQVTGEQIAEMMLRRFMADRVR